MKQFFYGLLAGLIILGLIGLTLFDNFKTKLRILTIENFLNNAVQQSQRQQPIQQSIMPVKPKK